MHDGDPTRTSRGAAGGKKMTAGAIVAFDNTVTTTRPYALAYAPSA